jgi:ubiquinone/menaquinone biosynthesis C-methylase UbiE
VKAADPVAEAISTHSRQASVFSNRYATLAGDTYRSCFAYSRHRLEVVLRAYLPEAGNGFRLLDVGCGTGHHLAVLRARGFDGSGVDGSAEMLERARHNNLGADIRLGEIQALPFDSAQFDFVICIEVLRYLPAPDACLREICRVLRPGGTCLVTAAPLLNSNGYWLVNRLASGVGVRGLVPLRQHFVTTGEFRRVFARAGLVQARVHGVYTGPINWIERLVPWALPIALRAWEPFDKRLADLGPLRGVANMFLGVGRKP